MVTMCQYLMLKVKFVRLGGGSAESFVDKPDRLSLTFSTQTHTPTHVMTFFLSKNYQFFESFIQYALTILRLPNISMIYPPLYQDHLVLPRYSWMYGHPLGKRQTYLGLCTQRKLSLLPEATNWQQHPSSGRDHVPNSPLPAGICSILGLHACSHIIVNSHVQLLCSSGR